MKLKTTLAAFLAALTLTSCEDIFEDGSMQPDGSKPSLTIINPTANQAVQQAKGLRIYLSAFDKDEVKNMEFTVRGSETDLLSFNKVMNKTAFEFDTTVAVSDIRPGSYQLIVRATDGRTNVAQQIVSFTVK
ncbi:Ig-like domain-containing protein [Pontibacter burrus]|uniref:DUF4625 domain-containing protein n=1 Tax=Pontibacter burrus TaxID=2704466 RepID=A0A6B3LTV3_9BACT|nr:Ig-like domain-containing protein [Pontibacter burrus]NEM99253.1 hypothetical protein [Pontibacter burrus]